MYRTHLLELSRTKAKSQDATYNSVWQNTLDPLYLPAGSTIQLHQAFIDEGKKFNPDDIEIDTDIEVEMTWVYYINDIDNGVQKTYQGVAGGDQNNGFPYIAFQYSVARGLLDTLQGTLTFIIPKGIYSPTRLAELVTDRMSNLHVHIDQTNATPPEIKGNTVLQNTISKTHVYSVSSVQVFSLIIGARFICEITPEIETQFATGNFLYFSYTDDDGYHNWQRVQISQAPTPAQPYVEFGGGSNDGSTVENMKIYADDNSNHDYVAFFMAGDKASGQFFYYPSNEVFYGASQTALVYDESERFKWQFLHTPYYIPGTGSTVGIKVDNTQNTFKCVASLGGIAFTKLEPQSFWQDTLGFKIDRITRPLAQYESFPASAYNVLNASTTITSALVGNASLPAQNNTDGMIVQGNVYYIATSDTDSIIADYEHGGSSSKNSGYYYIDIAGLEANPLKNETQTSFNINGVISRNYDTSSGTITGYSESGTVHIIERPTQIQNFNIRILNPSENTPAPNLGELSSIFIEVTVPIEQPNNEKQRKNKSKV